MSRIGKLPINLPKGVTVTWEEPVLRVKGPKGELRLEVRPTVGIKIEDGVMTVSRPDDSRTSRSHQGLYRSLIHNMVVGVSAGYEKKLEIVGVGYRAETSGDVLKLSLGFAFPKEFKIPPGISIRVDKDVIIIEGSDKQIVGNVAASIRAHRPPEPYKGKGIRYQGEQIKRKAGKAAGGK